MFDWIRARFPASRGRSPVAERFEIGLREQREQTDARIFWVLIAQWAVILVSSITMAAQWQHVRVYVLSSAVVWVGVVSVLPLAMVLRAPGSRASCWSVMLSQSVMSALLWYVSGGSPETYLHLFAWLVVLALYRDVPALLATVAVAMAGHLLIRNSGLEADSPSRNVQFVWLAWLVGESAFLGIFILLDRKSLLAQAERDHALETLQEGFQGQMEAITRKLADERDYLTGEVVSLTDRWVALESARFRISRELTELKRDVSTQATTVLELVSPQEDSSLNREWRIRWQTLRQQAQKLMRLVDISKIDDSEAEPEPEPELAKNTQATHAEQHRQRKSAPEKRAMLLMRNAVQQAKAVAALESEGYRVDVVTNGPRTYYSVMLNDYSVIVVDIDLPGEEGFDTLEALGLLPDERTGISKSLFAITAELTPDRVLRCTELRVDGMFLKPLKAESLHETLSAPNSNRPAWNEPRSPRGSHVAL